MKHPNDSNFDDDDELQNRAPYSPERYSNILSNGSTFDNFDSDTIENINSLNPETKTLPATGCSTPSLADALACLAFLLGAAAVVYACVDGESSDINLGILCVGATLVGGAVAYGLFSWFKPSSGGANKQYSSFTDKTVFPT